jgi:hypothetical protein
MFEASAEWRSRFKALVLVTAGSLQQRDDRIIGVA